MVVKKRMKVSRLSGAESVMGKRDKLEVYTLFNRKPMKMFKNTRRVCVLSESVTGNDSGKCVLDALEPIDIFLCSTAEKRVGIVQAGEARDDATDLAMSSVIAERIWRSDRM